MKTYFFAEAVEQPAGVTGLIIKRMKAEDFIPRLHEFTALEWLKITDSDISDLPEIPLPNLRTLLLIDNNLTSLPVAITTWQNLEILSIEADNLKHLPEQLCDLKRLKQLVLYCPKLRQSAPLAKAFAHWPHLEILNLTGKFKTLPSSIRHLKALKKLFLKKMPNLVELPDVFESLPNLEMLFIETTGLTSLPKSISALQKLKRLAIMDCSISTLPMPLPESLEELIVIVTKITSVPAGLFQHPNLMTINLFGNWIKEVQAPSLCRRAPFKHLNLSANEIKHLPDEFFKLPINDLIIDENPLAPETEKMLKQTFPRIDI